MCRVCTGIACPNNRTQSNAIERQLGRTLKVTCANVILTPSSFPTSLLPIEPFAPRRSSSGQMLTSCSFREKEQPSSVLHCFLETSPTVLSVQPRSAPELTQTVSWYLFRFRMPCQKLLRQRRRREAPWIDDFVPSLTDGRLRLNWTLSSPSRGIVSRFGGVYASNEYGYVVKNRFCRSCAVESMETMARVPRWVTRSLRARKPTPISKTLSDHAVNSGWDPKPLPAG